MTTEILPHFLVDLLPSDNLILASPTQTIIASIQTGDVIYRIDHDKPMNAPRNSAVLALHGSNKTAVDCLVALLGDDKELQVFKTNGLSSANASMTRIWSSPLPKRGVKMVWEDDDNEMEKVLVVGDRHGDVRSFVIPLNENESEGREAKKMKTSTAIETEGEDQDDIDTEHPPHLGHVSMLTDMILTSFTDSTPQIPAKYIITSDRDEHIRISRWGKRKAGHLALRYLLGSTEAIGGLCVVDQDLHSVLQESVTSAEAKSICRTPLLLSTDSSRLRIWSLHKDDDEERDVRKNCLLIVDLHEAILPYLKVNAKREQAREKSFGKGKVDSKKIQKKIENGQTTEQQEEKEEVVTLDQDQGSIVMMHLSAKHINGEVFLSFVVDGASALFSVSLSKLLSLPKENAASLIRALDITAPIVNHVHQDKGEEYLVWMTCDIRSDVTKDTLDQQGLKMAKWNRTTNQWKEEDSKANLLLERQSEFQPRGTAEVLNSLLLYDALTLYTKQEFERTTLVEDSVAPNGLVRGGLANFERVGKLQGNTGLANRGNSERETGKKVKARNQMLKRIEQALGEDK